MCTMAAVRVPGGECADGKHDRRGGARYRDAVRADPQCGTGALMNHVLDKSYVLMNR